MNKFVEALDREVNLTETDNGAPAFKSTKKANLDFYGSCGSIGANIIELKNKFIKAINEDSDLAIRNLLNMRDIRGGKGVRNNSRQLFQFAIQAISKELIPQLLSKFVEVGRYDDLFSVYGINAYIDDLVENLFIFRLARDDALSAKWTPLNQKDEKSKKFIKSLRSKLGFTPKQLRKFIVEKRNVVETKMCSKNWSDISYSSVPSQAMRIYKNAFKRNDEERFSNYLGKVESGEEKINSSTLYPHEIIGKRLKDIDKSAELQWKALPDYIKSGISLFPMVDVSGSMACSSYGVFNCMDISVALGLYLSERNKSVFKNRFLTFHTNPEFVVLGDSISLREKVHTTRTSAWGGSTDLDKAFKKIVELAVDNDVKQEDMPEYLVVLSDMQFNKNDYYFSNPISLEVENLFNSKGYKTPKLIWWNLSTRTSNVPVTFDQNGSAFISGFSPSVMTSVLSDGLESFTPLNVMLKDLMQDKYNINL